MLSSAATGQLAPGSSVRAFFSGEGESPEDHGGDRTLPLPLALAGLGGGCDRWEGEGEGEGEGEVEGDPRTGDDLEPEVAMLGFLPPRVVVPVLDTLEEEDNKLPGID